MSGTRERPTAVGQPKSKHPLSARVVGSAARLSPDGSEFTAYVVTASHADGRTWNLYKRFSDFVAVRDWLVQEPDFSVFVSELPFPSKKLWGAQQGRRFLAPARARLVAVAAGSGRGRRLACPVRLHHRGQHPEPSR
jgi:hypothetical protein